MIHKSIEYFLKLKRRTYTAVNLWIRVLNLMIFKQNNKLVFCDPFGKIVPR